MPLNLEWIYFLLPIAIIIFIGIVIGYARSKNTARILEQNQALASSGTGLWNWDVTKNKIILDKEASKLFGIQNNFTGDCATIMEFIHADDRKRVAEEMKNHLQSPHEFQINFRIVTPGRAITHLGLRGKTCLSTKRHPLYMTGACWDMTQYKAIENELAQAKESVEEAARLKSTFMARISHDLRSPLNGIIGFAELMYHGKVGPISEEHKEYLGDILTSARHLLLLINDVVDIAKVESGNMSFHPEHINMNKVLKETLDLFQEFAASKNIQIVTSTDPDLTNIYMDPTRLKQVIYNYVSNAIKCTPDNGHIIIRAVANSHDTFRIEVEDNGVGIQPGDLKKLFTEFQQLDLDVAKKYQGTGLGLALVRHIVEAQGGQVGVSSIYGKGSQFFAILPCSLPSNVQEDSK